MSVALASAQQPPPDSLLYGMWSADYAGSPWQVDVGPNMRYRIWRVEPSGDTLVASMGSWEVRGGHATRQVCFLPAGRRAMCSPVMLVDMGRQVGTRWRFEDPSEDGIKFVAYRLGRAPWDAGDEAPIYSFTEVERPPRLLGCSETPWLPDGESGPRRVYTELVVEPDSTATQIRVLDAPGAEWEERTLTTVRSCRFVPGKNGQAPVRVRVRLPIDFRPRP